MWWAERAHRLRGLRGLCPRASKEPFLTLSFAPGSAFQVDWADFGFAVPGCAERQLHLPVGWM